MLELPWAYGRPTEKARLRQQAADFFVDEQLQVEFSGQGEFDWVLLEKTGLNTIEAATVLQEFSGAQEVSYSGLKDKQAVTRQWFSLHMLGKPSADWQSFQHPHCQVLQSCRHHRKLRRGTHQRNRFELVLRDVELGAIEHRMEQVRQYGVPNYFGEQRFGHQGRNVEEAQRWLTGGRRPGRHKRSLLLSAARSHLFNQVLAARVEQGNWNRALEGEVFVLGDSGSLFQAERDALIEERVARGDIQPSGPLYGEAAGKMPQSEVAALEAAILAPFPELCHGLERQRVKAARRSLRLLPEQWTVSPLEDSAVKLGFTLPRGCFATVLVRELVDYSDSR